MEGEWSSGVAAANPTYRNAHAEKKGMVAIDFRVIDGKTGRVFRSFKSEGNFKSEAGSEGFSLFGVGHSETKYAASALGQAITKALNAVQQINDSLVGPVKTVSLR